MLLKAALVAGVAVLLAAAVGSSFLGGSLRSSRPSPATAFAGALLGDAAETTSVSALCVRGTSHWLKDQYEVAGRYFSRFAVAAAALGDKGGADAPRVSCGGLELAFRNPGPYYLALASPDGAAAASTSAAHRGLAAFAAMGAGATGAMPSDAWAPVHAALYHPTDPLYVEACLLLAGFFEHAAETVTSVPLVLLSFVETCIEPAQMPLAPHGRLLEATMSLVTARLQAAVPAARPASPYHEMPLVDALALAAVASPPEEGGPSAATAADAWALIDAVAKTPLLFAAARLPLHGGPYLPEVEVALTHSRRLLLQLVLADALLTAAVSPTADYEVFATQLASVCFDNEYVFALTPSEAAATAGSTRLEDLVVRRLAASLAGDDAAAPVDGGVQGVLLVVAVLASYRPLHAVPRVAALLQQLTSIAHLLLTADSAALCMFLLLHHQIEVPAAEALIRLEITAEAQQQQQRAAAPTAAGSTASHPLLHTGNSKADAVTAAVATMYEANPYPRWRHVLMCLPGTRVCAFGSDVPTYATQIGGINPHPVSTLSPKLRRSYNLGDLYEKPQQSADRKLRILFAGCGTGRQVLQAALAQPDATIVGIDLSAASLAYAAMKLRYDPYLAHLNVTGRIFFLQRNILSLSAASIPPAEKGNGGDDSRFDVIEVTGVLHHLDDPEAGLRALRQHLRPGGAIKIALYSKTAREYSGVYAARRRITRQQALPADHAEAAAPNAAAAARGGSAATDTSTEMAQLPLDASPAAIRRGREVVFAAVVHAAEANTFGVAFFAEDADEALAEESIKVARLQHGDFHSLSDTRDLMFHVHEQAYTIPEVGALLRRQDLLFVGFDIDRSDPQQPAAIAHLKLTAKRLRRSFARGGGSSRSSHAPADSSSSSRMPKRNAAGMMWMPFEDWSEVTINEDLATWHSVEQELPGTFAGMYQLWAVMPD